MAYSDEWNDITHSQYEDSQKRKAVRARAPQDVPGTECDAIGECAFDMQCLAYQTCADADVLADWYADQ